MDFLYAGLELDQIPTAELPPSLTLCSGTTQEDSSLEENEDFWARSGFFFVVGNPPADTIDEVLQLTELCSAERLLSTTSSSPSAKLRKLMVQRTISSSDTLLEIQRTLSYPKRREKPVKCRISMPEFSNPFEDDDTVYEAVWRGDIHEWVDVPVTRVTGEDKVSDVSVPSGSAKESDPLLGGRRQAKSRAEDNIDAENEKDRRRSRVLKRLEIGFANIRAGIERLRARSRSPRPRGYERL